MANLAEVKKQVEYYLGDDNLKVDDFFRDKITANQGFVNIEIFLACNKIKKLGVSVADIAEAVKNSTELDLSEDKKSISRKNNRALPEKTGNLKKRDVKAADKKAEQAVKQDDDQQ